LNAPSASEPRGTSTVAAGSANPGGSPAQRQYYFVCARSELGMGTPHEYEVHGRAVVVVDIGDEVACLGKACPHMGAPLAAGAVGPTCLPHGFRTYLPEREGEVLRCPWHGWEFDLRTGRCLHNAKTGVRRLDTQIRNGEVWVTFQRETATATLPQSDGTVRL
jgi:nitrite reductase (NADH) small subunit